MIEVLAQATESTAGTGVSTGEAIAFWILGPLAVIAALGMVLSRNAVHSALFLAGVMLSLAGLYAAQEAPFLAAVQVIVYTGAVLMLFLFVLMLVGVDASDSLVETLRGQRVATVLLGVGFAGLLMAAIGSAVGDTPGVGLAEAQPDGNVAAIGTLLFVKYVVAFEVVSALLITAAIGAFVLAHKEKTGPVMTQREMAKRRFASGHPFPQPGPGVFAGHHSTATPALLPDGSISEESVPGPLQITPADSDGTVRKS